MLDKKNNYIGKNMRYLRKKMGITLDQFSRDVNIASGFLGLLERGQRGASLENLFKIADYLGVRFDLFVRTDVSLENPEENTEEEKPIDTKAEKHKRYIIKKLTIMNDDEVDFIYGIIKKINQYELLKK